MMVALDLMWLLTKGCELAGSERYKRNPEEVGVSQGLVSYSVNDKVMRERLILD